MSKPDSSKPTQLKYKKMQTRNKYKHLNINDLLNLGGENGMIENNYKLTDESKQSDNGENNVLKPSLDNQYTYNDYKLKAILGYLEDNNFAIGKKELTFDVSIKI